MENRQQQILDEIKSMIVTLRRQVEELESKMAELQPMDDVTEMEVSLDIMDMGIASEPHISPDLVETTLQEPIEEQEVSSESDDLPFFDEPVDEPALEQAVESIVEPSVEPSVESVSTVAAEELPAPVAVIDAMTAKQAWRTDMPGTPVRDIRSAISLNDRILFINYLFNEDPMVFQETLTILNSMSSFDDAVSHVVARHPEWDLESDTVYRFMMALRRRLQ